MPRPTLKGVWSEYHDENKSYPEVWIMVDEKPVAKFRADEATKFLNEYMCDRDLQVKQVKENKLSYERQKEYERKYGRDD